MARIVVVLPAPLRPSRATTCPSSTVSDSPLSTEPSPYPPERSRSSSIVPPRPATQVCLLCVSVLSYLVRGALCKHRAVVQHGDAVGEGEDHAHAVLDKDDGHVARQSLEPFEERRDLVGSQTRRRLIQEQQARPHGEARCQFQAT